MVQVLDVRRWSAWLAAGVLATCVLATTLGCGDSEPITAANSKYRPSAAQESGGTEDAESASTSASTSASRSPTGPVVSDVPAVGAPTATTPPRGAPSGAAPGDAVAAPSVPPPADPTTPRDVEPAALAERLLTAASERGNIRRGQTQQEQIQLVGQDYARRIGACEQVLQMEGIPEYRLEAVHLKLQLLQEMAAIGFPDAQKHFGEFCEGLQQDSHPEIAHIGKLATLISLANRFMQQTDGDFEPVEKKFEEVLAGPTFGISDAQMIQQTVQALHRRGFPEPAKRMLERFVEKCGASEDQELVKAAADMEETGVVLRSNFDGARDKFIEAEPGTEAETTARAAYVELIEGLLQDEKRGPIVLMVASQAADDIERTGAFPEADKLFAAIGAAYAENKSEETVAESKRMAESAKRRLALLDTAPAVTGVALDGQPYDWSSYAGKSVLVFFWAPQEQSTGRVMQEMFRLYQTYHEKGLETVGVAIGSPGEVRQGLQLQPLPWRTISDGAGDSSISEQWGVSFLPFSVLIGPDGKIQRVHCLEPSQRAGLLADLEKLAPAPEGQPTGGAAQPADESKGDEPKADEAKGEEAKPADNEQSRARRRAGSASFVGLFDEPPADSKPADSKPDDKSPGAAEGDAPAEAPQPKDEVENPYLAKPGLSPAKLVDFLFNMEEKPLSIRRRDGFDEAIIDAADRVLAADAKPTEDLVAIEAKFQALHRLSLAERTGADERLDALVAELQEDSRERVRAEVAFQRLERRVRAGDDVPLADIPTLLDEVRAFCEATKMGERHLRLASATIHLVNRLEDGDAREARFKELGGLFARSKDSELARYGRRLSAEKGAAPSDLVGKPLELAGATALGLPFDWASYRGKVVIVDFWATWCGPCVREIPNVKAFYEQQQAAGLEIVGVSLDKDLDAVAQFIEEHKLAWTTLIGDETQELAQKYSVRAIPTMMLVDREGKVVAVSHKISDLEAKARELLGK